MVYLVGIVGVDFSLVDVIRQVKADKGKELHVVIKSFGGYTDEGFKIFNYLQNQGRKVHTYAIDECASMATIIFMAGHERYASCDLIIHNPFIRPQGEPSLDEVGLQKWLSEVQNIKKQIADIYKHVTRIDADTLSQLMSDETFIRPEDAVTFGFATKVLDKKLFIPSKFLPKNSKQNNPLAVYKSGTYNIINQIHNKMSKDKKSAQDKTKKEPKKDATTAFLDEVLNLAQNLKLKTVALVLQDANGDEITVNTDAEQPAVGDSASPDGVYTMPNGDVMTIEDEVITSIESGGGSDASIEELQQEIDTLREDIEELINFKNEAITNLVKAKKIIEEQDAKITEVENRRNNRSDFAPPKRTFVANRQAVPKQEGDETMNWFAQRGAEIDESIKKRNEKKK